ncbi:4a-hydroxytetrahydrobiopterin dehydratase [Streptomyces sp. adm13(2018)]|uniref:4a-hydroxytetrahydrobiopterin dehydratase n=1 Tax=unclassified Streptomyces TaxID=2593676 RepID=UPI0011CE3D5B|nr:4a-hydroxytetrahydrobiopterin dehydratase [Streptomyces sp. adm13(2018)]TXS05033.1 4a-hydroxytetrahydrobiopterin dehydratase [Streptomyces sp. adm13(2018)]
MTATPTAAPDGWEVRDSALVRVFEPKTFPELLATVERVERIAEAANHHPDIEIRWRPPVRTPADDPAVKLPAVLSLTFRCNTHTLGSVTEADAALAASIETALVPAG